MTAARPPFTGWRVAWGAIAAPFAHFGALLRFGIGPLAFAMLLFPPSYTFAVNGQTILSLTDGVYTIWDAVRFLAALPFAAAFAAAWIRLSVSGDETTMGSFTTPFDQRTWRVAWAFIRMLPVLAVAVVVVLVPWVLAFGRYADGQLLFGVQVHGWAVLPLALATLASIVVITWFMLRFALTIPGAATGETDLSLRQSWQKSRPIQFRMLGAALLLLLASSVVLMLFIFAVAMMAPVVGASVAFYGGVPMLFLLFMFGHAFWAGLLGASYRAIQESTDRGEIAAFE